MAMPEQDTDWPPTAFAAAIRQVKHDADWLANTATDHPATTNPRPVTSAYQYNGGIMGAGARALLGRPTAGPGVTARPRTLPIAGSLCGVSADIMAGEPPAVTLHPDDAENEKAAQALDELTSSDMFAAELHQAMKRCAGLGWTYPRIVWNENIQQHPWIEWVDADRAFAEYEHGRLKSVLFWDEYPDPKDKRVFYRLLQEHTPGRITYALYRGTRASVGKVVPLNEIPQTAHLAELVDTESGIDTYSECLTAGHIINGEEAMEWRDDPQLRYYGASDIRKGGGLWEDINTTWSNLKHEEEAGRGRLLVSEDLLTSGKPGMGQYFDWARDVYPLSPSGDPDSSGTIKPVQFELRFDKYLLLLAQQLMQAAQAVGLSALTVGAEKANANMTATEIRALSERTIATAKAKGRYLRAGLSEVITAYLSLDAELNGYEPPTRLVNVALPEVVQETELDRTQAAQNLRSADAASTRYLVRRLHPEWTQPEVDDEVAEILAERKAGMPSDPFAIGFDEDPNTANAEE